MIAAKKRPIKKKVQSKTKKKVAKKKATTKKVAKKKVTKKKARPSTSKKSPVKKAPSVKSKRAKKQQPSTPTKKTVKKSTASKKGRKPAKKTNKPVAATPKTKPKTKASSAAKDILINARKRKAALHHHLHTRKNTPIVFTLEDVRDIIDKRADIHPLTVKEEITTYSATPKKMPPPKPPTVQRRVLGAASLTDILGFNPTKKTKASSQKDQIKKIPKKHLPYYKALLALREHFVDELDVHSKETLKRSSKEDAGDVSGYGNHMADTGTETFDRDLALSLLSNEQNALYEIEEAIQRIIDGTYGICEKTGKPIAKERLTAVPFTRFSLEGQLHQENMHRRTAQRGGGVFAEAADETAVLGDDDTES